MRCVRLDSSSKDVTSSKQKLPFAVRREKEGEGREQRANAKRARREEGEGGGFSSGTESRPNRSNRFHPKTTRFSNRLSDGVKSRIGLRAAEGSWETRLTVSLPPSSSLRSRPRLRIAGAINPVSPSSSPRADKVFRFVIVSRVS